MAGMTVLIRTLHCADRTALCFMLEMKATSNRPSQHSLRTCVLTAAVSAKACLLHGCLCCGKRAGSGKAIPFNNMVLKHMLLVHKAKQDSPLCLGCLEDAVGCKALRTGLLRSGKFRGLDEATRSRPGLSHLRQTSPWAWPWTLLFGFAAIQGYEGFGGAEAG